jgi:hypothetical protein
VEDVLHERAPLFVSKRLSSIAITASLTTCGISLEVTITRFCWLTTPIGWPRSSSRTELFAFLIVEKRASDGRSEATETKMPKTNEIRPSTSTAKTIATKRKRLTRRRGPLGCSSSAGAGAGGMSGRTTALIGEARRGPRDAGGRLADGARRDAAPVAPNRAEGSLAPARV